MIFWNAEFLLTKTELSELSQVIRLQKDDSFLNFRYDGIAQRCNVITSKFLKLFGNNDPDFPESFEIVEYIHSYSSSRVCNEKELIISEPKKAVVDKKGYIYANIEIDKKGSIKVIKLEEEKRDRLVKVNGYNNVFLLDKGRTLETIVEDDKGKQKYKHKKV